jgi:galactokinase
MDKKYRDISDQKVELHVGGRLCLFGEHSDWAAEYGLHKGFCLVIGTNQGLTAVIEPSDRFTVKTLVPAGSEGSSAGTRQMSCPWDADRLLEEARNKTEFFRYCAGVAYQMYSLPKVTGGIDIQINSIDLPLKKGVSSSAAVCILVARAFQAVYGLRLFMYELMELAYLGEKLTGSQCGRMDQACIYGKTPVLLTFQKSEPPRIEPIFPEKEINIFFVDLVGEKNTVRILSDLNCSYLKSKNLQRALGEENERIVRSAHHALTTGEAHLLGELMTEAQRQFDEFVAPHSPDELKSPLLHAVLELDDIAEHIYGGKGVGSHGDGTAQFVARSAADRDSSMEKISRHFPGMRCFPLTIVPQGPRSSSA